MKSLSLTSVVLSACLCATAPAVETTVEDGTIYPGGAVIAYDEMMILSTVRFSVDNLPPVDEDQQYVIKDITLRVDLDHTWAADVQANLTFNGMTVGLFQDAASSADFATSSGAEYWVHDDGDAWPRRGIIPSGTYRPDVSGNAMEDRLATFEGMDPTGVWLLRIADDFPGHDGTFYGWRIGLTLETIPVPEPISGAWLVWAGLVATRRLRT